jgi:hypothetical protein
MPLKLQWAKRKQHDVPVRRVQSSCKDSSSSSSSSGSSGSSSSSSRKTEKGEGEGGEGRDGRTEKREEEAIRNLHHRVRLYFLFDLAAGRRRWRRIEKGRKKKRRERRMEGMSWCWRGRGF